MKIAFTAKGKEMSAQIDERFGRTDFLVLYNEETEEISSIDNRSIANVAHGAGPQTGQKIFELGADILITGNGPGGNAAAVLRQGKLKIYTGAAGMTLQEAYAAYKNGQLTEN